jgi:hypothetical protein
VAAHYSNRYSSSEHFIESSFELKQYVMYLQTHSQEDIISNFIEHSTQPANDSFQITWKQIHYIWKHYLTYQNIPNMIYSNALKQMLKQRLLYDESSDMFVNLTSKYLPNISHFLKFWEDNVLVYHGMEDQVSLGTLLNYENEIIMVKQSERHVPLNELEISELSFLYGSSSMKENDIVRLIQHFFPEIIILDNKYIQNVECKLWNKQSGIINLLESYKNKRRDHKGNLVPLNYEHGIIREQQVPLVDIVSIDDLYNEYANKINGKLNVSKQYFEKYIHQNLSKYIVYDTFIDFQQMNE